MQGLHKVLALHKKKFSELVDTLGIEVIVRQPAAKIAGGNDAANVLGTRARDTGVGVSKTVIAIVSASMSASPQEAHLTPVALLHDSDYYLRMRLEDALLDATKIHGKTIFETAKEIEAQGTKFKFSGIAKTGFANLGPYILWVGLKHAGG